MDNKLRVSDLMAVVSDNAAYMVKCVNDLNSKHGFNALHVRCAAHMLNLLVEKWLNFTAPMTILYRLAAFMRTGSKADRDRITHIVNSDMMRGTATRWTYYLDAIAALLGKTVPPAPYNLVYKTATVRFKLLHDAVMQWMPASDLAAALDIQYAEERFAFAQRELGPARELFTRLQARVGDCFDDIKELQALLGKWKRPSTDADSIGLTAAQQLHQYQHSYPLCVTDEFVTTMQPRVMQALTKMTESITRNWLLMDELLALKVLFHPTSRHMVSATFPKLRHGFLSLQDGHPHAAAWDSWVLGRASVLALSAQLARYTSTSWTATADQAATEFWRSRNDIWPELARFALSVVQLPLSSAEVERVFSKVTLMEVETNRSLLAGENFLTELKLRANPDLLEAVCDQAAEQLNGSAGTKRCRDD